MRSLDGRSREKYRPGIIYRGNPSLTQAQIARISLDPGGLAVVASRKARQFLEHLVRRDCRFFFFFYY